MRKTFLTIFGLLFFNCADSQITFSYVAFNLSSVSNQKGTELTYADSSLSIKFQLTQKSVQLKDNFISVDSQLIQITTLKVNGLTKNLDSLNTSEEKQLLGVYSKYELDYFIKELKIGVINPNNQWVVANSKNWLIWYFRVGDVAVQAEKKTEIQLFASTIIAGKILTINAPILTGDNFGKAALIVNQMMESLKSENKK